MSPEITTVLAVWGAVVSTSTLAWNLWKWRQEKPKIVARATTFGPDDPVGIRFEVRNRGGRPTTIEEVRLFAYQPGAMGLLRMKSFTEYLGAIYPDATKLPHPLGPGALWTADIPIEEEHRLGFDQGERVALIKQKRLHFSITCAHSDRCLTGTVLEENITPWS